MKLVTSRRSLITGLISFVAAPAIVRASSLMPIKTMLWVPSTFPITGYALQPELTPFDGSWPVTPDMEVGAERWSKSLDVWRNGGWKNNH